MKRHFESGVGTGLGTMPITIVWGVKAVDAVDKLDPFSKGGVVYDDSFNPATPRAQRWLLRFCRAVRATDFNQREPGLQLTNCFIEHSKLFMESGCDATASAAQRACCGFDEFPYNEDVFNRCLRVYMPVPRQPERRAALREGHGPAGGARRRVQEQGAALVKQREVRRLLPLHGRLGVGAHADGAGRNAPRLVRQPARLLRAAGEHRRGHTCWPSPSPSPSPRSSPS